MTQINIGDALNLAGSTRLLTGASLFAQKWASVPPMNQPVPYAWGNSGMIGPVSWIAGYANINATGTPPNYVLDWSTLGSDLEVYPTAARIAKGSNPFGPVVPNALDVKARLLSAAEIASLAGNSALTGKKWLSGAGVTFPAGLAPPAYFEFTARVGTEQGQWDAFWLLGADDQWPPEIDILEAVNPSGANLEMTCSVHTTDKTWEGGAGSQTKIVPFTADPQTTPHRYGALVYPDLIAIFWDGVCVNTWPTPADLTSKVLYMLFDHGVGAPGSWAGTPAAGVTVLEDMTITDLGAWSMPAVYAGATPVPTPVPTSVPTPTARALITEAQGLLTQALALVP